MRIKILGCSGGIGGALRTTSLLVDRDILIDAGTGVGDLTIDEMMAIDHIFVTHSHLDHIAFIPFLIDTVNGLRHHPVTVHAIPETIQSLKEHIFNWKIWPDFNVIPDREQPFLKYSVLQPGAPVDVAGRTITPVPANHVVPAVGYCLDSGRGSLIFTGDTASCDALWQKANAIANLKHVIIETSFTNAEADMARLSKHLCPSMLFEELAKLERPAEVYITHLKPGEGEKIMREIQREQYSLVIKELQHQQIFEL